MGKILNIETTTTNCSVALGEDGRVVAIKEDYSDKYSHAERLHVYIQELFKESGWKLSDLDAVAVSKGPGSYTGLRIGVSSAKGLSFAQDLPLISISTLQALALQVKQRDIDYIVPMLDARRMEVYTAVFTITGELVWGIQAKILDSSSYSDLLEKGSVAFIGNGVEKFKELCNHPNALMLEDKLPSAKEMVHLSEKNFQEGQFEDLAYFEPFYLKDFLVTGKSLKK